MYSLGNKSSLISCWSVGFFFFLNNLHMKQAGILSWCPLSCFSAQDFIKAEPADALRTRVRPLVIITCANLLYLSLKKNRLLYHFYFRLIDGLMHLKWLNYCWHRDLWALNFYPTDFFFFIVMVQCFVFFDLPCFRPLEPILSENESFDLLKVCVNSVISLPPETHTPEKNKDDEILDPKQRKVFSKTFINAENSLFQCCCCQSNIFLLNSCRDCTKTLLLHYRNFWKVCLPTIRPQMACRVFSRWIVVFESMSSS